MRRACGWTMTLAAGCVVAAGCGDNGQHPAADASPDPGGHGDAAIDASVDSPAPQARYDVAYANELTIPFNYGISGFVMIVNRGTAPLHLAGTSVQVVSDDDPAHAWLFELSEPSSTDLPPGYAAGSLSQEAMTKLVGSGLVPEPSGDNVIDFRMSFPFSSLPAVGSDVHAQARLQIGDASILLPFTLHIIGSPTTALDHVVRISTR